MHANSNIAIPKLNTSLGWITFGKIILFFFETLLRNWKSGVEGCCVGSSNLYNLSHFPDVCCAFYFLV